MQRLTCWAIHTKQWLGRFRGKKLSHCVAFDTLPAPFLSIGGAYASAGLLPARSPDGVISAKSKVF
jgi:hypothetical protein